MEGRAEEKQRERGQCIVVEGGISGPKAARKRNNRSRVPRTPNRPKPDRKRQICPPTPAGAISPHLEPRSVNPAILAHVLAQLPGPFSPLLFEEDGKPGRFLRGAIPLEAVDHASVVFGRRVVHGTTRVKKGRDKEIPGNKNRTPRNM